MYVHMQVLLVGMCNSDRVLGHDSNNQSWKQLSWVKKILIGYSSTLGGTRSRSDVWASYIKIWLI